MNRATYLLLALLGTLMFFALLGDNYAKLALPGAALAAALPLLWRRPRSVAWVLVTAGAALWSVEEVAWSISRLSETFAASYLTDITYYLGAVAWFIGLILFPRRSLSPLLVVASLPAIGLVLWLLFSNISATVELGFPVVELLLAVAALPLLGGTLRGGASDGRLLVVLSFYFRAVGAASYSWLAGGTEIGFLVVWLLSYVLLALGIYMELFDVHAELLAAGAAVISLQLLSGWLLILLYRLTEVGGVHAVGIVVMLAYLQFAVVMLIIYLNGERQAESERELEVWAALLGGVVVETGDGPTLENLLARTLAGISSLQGVEVHDESSRGVLAGYGYPLVADGTEVGRLYFSKQPVETAVIDMVAPLLATRILHLGDQHRWRTAALTDPLTGLLNRRGLELRTPLLFEKAGDQRLAVSVAMIDIDHFKRVNDVYGHAIGDDALRALARLLQHHTRPNDLAVRWGGEEFVMVLVDSNQHSAGEVVRRLRQELHLATPRPIAWPLAVSVGIAGGSVPSSGEALERWLQQADEALLRAKSSGRNRVELYDH